MQQAARPSDSDVEKASLLVDLIERGRVADGHEAFRQAGIRSLGPQEVRRTLVALASTDGREVVSFGYDQKGLVASVIYQPRGELRFEPVWVPRQLNAMFVQLLRVLERSALPFPDHDET